MALKYRKFDPIFKENVVKASYNKSSLKAFADELKIDPSMLSRWRRECQKFGTGSFPGSGRAKVHPENRQIFDLEKKSRESELKLEILKNGLSFLFQGSPVIYQFIKENESNYSIEQMCRVLGICKRVYFKWKKNGIPQKHQQTAVLKTEIASIFYSLNKHCGRDRIAKELNSRGYKISPRQVTFYMQQLGLRSRPKKKFKITTDSKHNHYTAPNILNRQFKTDAPGKTWVSDITYIQIKTGFLYLTVIIDLYDRKIVGWSTSSVMTAQKTAVAAWRMAVINRPVTDALIFHSDRGVQYASRLFTAELESYKCTRSMSRKANSLDNAVSESFFSSFKRELLYRKNTLLAKKEMKAEIFEYIENWYNKKRIHSALNFKTIDQFNSDDRAAAIS